MYKKVPLTINSCSVCHSA